MAKDNVFFYFSKVQSGRLQKNVSEKIPQALEYFEGDIVEVIIRKKKSRRSDQQNRYWWAIVTIFANELGYTKDECHEILKYKFLKRSKVDENSGEVYEYLGSSAKLNKSEFSELTNNLIQWAATMNIILPLPNEQLTIE